MHVSALPVVTPTENGVNFKGKCSVRNLWMRGKLPEVLVDIYGIPLSKKTCSREHIIPKSLGGKAGNSNIALADKFMNSRRGSEKLSKFTTLENVVNYFMQFIGIQIREKGKVKFDGTKYFQSAIPSLKHEGFDIKI